MVKRRVIEDVAKTIPIVSAADTRAKSKITRPQGRFFISFIFHLVFQSRQSYQHSLLMKYLHLASKFHFIVQLSGITIISDSISPVHL